MSVYHTFSTATSDVKAADIGSPHPAPDVSHIDNRVEVPVEFAVDRFYKEFGRLVREARERAEPKITQEHLADIVGLSRTSITNIESGRQHIPLHTLFALADAVGVKVGELLPDPAFAAADGRPLLAKINQLQLSKTTTALLKKSVSPLEPSKKETS